MSVPSRPTRCTLQFDFLELSGLSLFPFGRARPSLIFSRPNLPPLSLRLALSTITTSLKGLCERSTQSSLSS